MHGAWSYIRKAGPLPACVRELEKLKEVTGAEPLLKLLVGEGHIGQNGTIIYSLDFVCSMDVCEDIDEIPWKRLTHYRLEELLRSGSSMTNKVHFLHPRKSLLHGRFHVKCRFEVNGVRWSVPYTSVSVPVVPLFGQCIRYVPCVDAERNFGIYLLEVIGKPDYEVNRFIPMTWNVGPRMSGKKLSGLGRSIDDPNWKSGKIWQEVVDKIDGLTSRKASS